MKWFLDKAFASIFGRSFLSESLERTDENMGKKKSSEKAAKTVSWTDVHVTVDGRDASTHERCEIMRALRDEKSLPERVSIYLKAPINFDGLL